MSGLLLVATLALQGVQEPPACPADEPGQALAGGLRLADFEAETVALYKALRPSLVGVRMTLQVEGMAPRELTSSGVVLDHWGLVVAPVALPRDVEGVEVVDIEVERMDSARFPAEVVAHSERYNLSLLRADDLLGMGPEISSGRTLEPGALTFAMGNGYGLPGNVSLGMVSGANRRLAMAGGLLQVTNPINPGDRGGILADREGRVVGVLLTSLAGAAQGLEAGEWGPVDLDGPDTRERLALQKEASGISFAVPMQVVAGLFPEQLGHLFPERRLLGVEIAPTVRVQVPEHGEPRREVLLQVHGVADGGAAARAGVRYGDVLLALGGTHVCSLAELGAALEVADADTTLVVERDGRRVELELRLTPRAVTGD